MTATTTPGLPVPARAAARAVRDAAAIGAAALVVYLLLRQETLYSGDSQWLLLQSLRGEAMHPSRFAFMPLLAAFRAVVLPLGGSIHDAGVLLSAIGTAAGVAAAHVANARAAMDRGTAFAATAATALAPAVVFFATVVELHGPHFGLCGAAFVATAAFAARPCRSRGALLGLATGLGWFGHATGALLPAMTVPIAVALAAERGHRWRSAAPGLALAIVVHAGVIAVVPAVLRALGHDVQLGQPLRFLAHYAAAFGADPTAALRPIVTEWLWPFLPISAAVLAGLCRPAARPLAIAVMLAAVPYLAVAALLVGDHGERGAYLLPLAWPAGLVAARTLGTGDGRRPRLAMLLVHVPERRPDRDWHLPTDFRDVPADGVAAAVARFDAIVRSASAAGTEVWITEGCVASLTGDGGGAGGPALLAHLRAACAWREARALAFTAWRLEPVR